MIKFVYFDIGGVLIIDFSNSNKWLQLEHDLGVNNLNRTQYDQIWQKNLSDVCIDYDVDFMLNELKISGYKVPNNYSILKDGFIKRFYKNNSILPIIQKIDLSNASIISNMYPKMLGQIIQKQIMPKQCIKWKVILDSSKIKLQKPDDKIYKIAINKSGYLPNQILFIYNTKEHLITADKLGINTYFYDSANTNFHQKNLIKN